MATNFYVQHGGSWVYFIREDRDGLVKIGTAKNPEARLVELQCGSAARLELLHAVPGGRDLERAFHMVFAPLRVRGEWFEPLPALLMWIGRPDLGRWRYAEYPERWGWLRTMNEELLRESLGLPDAEVPAS